MRRLAAQVVLSLAIFSVTALAQDPGFGPNGVPLRPPGPPDTSIARQQANQGSEAMVAPIKISYGRKSQQWTAAKLAALPHEPLRVSDEKTQAAQTYSGVPLMALLVEVGVPQKPRNNDFRLYIIAEGADGAKAVYSLAEVSPDVHDGQVLLADSVDGKPLTDGGPVQLICSGDRSPVRWIRGIVSIRVMKAD